jgi:hypothetical protein|tara:strand:+ start:176 stop:715 length:540 start_codon:yes stop_codon:yes gene_type:complete
MKKILIILIMITLVLPIVYPAQQKVYILNLKYNDGKITKESLIVTEGMYSEEVQPETGYRLELISFTDEVLYSRIFIFPESQKGPLPKESDILERTQYLPDITEKEPSLLKTSSVELMIPYYKDAKIVRIYDINDIKVLEIDVSSFAEKVTGEPGKIVEEPKPSFLERIINWFKALFGK